MAETTCRRCGLPIQFIRTPSGSSMPAGVKRQSVVTEDGRVVQGFTPHWAECPSAKYFRKPKKAGETVTRKEAQAAFAELKEQLGDDDDSGGDI